MISIQDNLNARLENISEKISLMKQAANQAAKNAKTVSEKEAYRVAMNDVQHFLIWAIQNYNRPLGFDQGGLPVTLANFTECKENIQPDEPSVYFIKSADSDFVEIDKRTWQYCVRLLDGPTDADELQDLGNL